MEAIDPKISERVLAIGIDYKSSRGGIPDVENYHSQFVRPYRFVATNSDGGKLRKFLFMARGLVRFTWLLATDRKIKIVHVHGCSDNSFWRKRMFINIASAFGRKVLYHMHGGGFKDFSLKHKEAVQATLDKCDVLVVLSDSWLDFFRDNFKVKHMEVVPNGVNPPATVDVPVKDDGVTTLLFLGMITPKKGIYDIIDAVAADRERYKGRLKIVLCGAGDVDAMMAKVHDKGVGDIVEYGGWVSGKDKACRLAQCDAFILPSYFEGMPVCILEAMSYGKPVIATRVGGIPDIISDGVNGILVNPGDVKALTEALNYALDNKEAMRHMGEESLSRIAAYLPSSVCARLESVYRHMLE